MLNVFLSFWIYFDSARIGSQFDGDIHMENNQIKARKMAQTHAVTNQPILFCNMAFSVDTSQ